MPGSKAVSGRVQLVPEVFAILSNGPEHGCSAFISLRVPAAARRSTRNWLSLTTNFATTRNIGASGGRQQNPPGWPHCDEGLAAEAVDACEFANLRGIARCCAVSSDKSTSPTSRRKLVFRITDVALVRSGVTNCHRAEYH
jgi:hypothetical protein